MKNQIYPCLWFDGQARAAADFYCAIFKNSKITVDTPMVVNFEIDGQKIMGLNGGTMFKINPSISFFVNCKTEDEINKTWNQLSSGGSVLMPLENYPWSERYGWVQDKFGLTWQLMLNNSTDVKPLITPSFLFTAGQFGRAEKAINFYASVFDNSSIGRLEHYPNETPDSGKVMYAEFKLNQQNLIAMDGPGVHEYTFNEAVSLVVDCETQKEIDYYWNKLTEGGAESMCGWLKDQFGVWWQIVPTALGKLMTDPQKAGRMMQVVMKTKKFDIEQLMNA